MTSLKDGISTLRQHKKWCKEEQTNSIELTVTVFGQYMPVKKWRMDCCAFKQNHKDLLFIVCQLHDMMKILLGNWSKICNALWGVFCVIIKKLKCIWFAMPPSRKKLILCCICCQWFCVVSWCLCWCSWFNL